MATDEAAREAALDARRAARHAEFLGFDAEAYRLGWHDGADHGRERAEALAVALERRISTDPSVEAISIREAREVLAAYRSGRGQS